MYFYLVKVKSSRLLPVGESILWAGLEEEEGQEEVVDPFIPQERVFSKYAAMLYTSNNTGKTFEEFKDAKYCASCGEKVRLCQRARNDPNNHCNTHGTKGTVRGQGCI